jgi:16S rRNA (guanine527-N7)-methyltransferase
VDERLRAYAELVRAWAPRLDLVAPRDLGRFEERHIGDSLRALPLVRSLPPGAAVDVGSGAGLPGIPLAISEPTRRWTLLEPRRGRAAFLEEVVRRLELGAEIVTARAESWGASRAGRRRYVVATARALAPPERAFALLEPLVAPRGARVVWVGAHAVIPEQAGEWAPGIAIIPRGPDGTSEGDLG